MLRLTRLLLISLAFLCLISQASSIRRRRNVDEDTGCPLGVPHVCQYCGEEQNRRGCYCETANGDIFITRDVFTPCPNPTTDPCNGVNCNNGTCVALTSSTHRCECSSGFHGAVCNETLTRCDDPDINCRNSECVQTNNPALPVYCQCYDGSRRDPIKNETCPRNPCFQVDSDESVCENNGICRIVNNDFVCECASGYAGRNCSRKLLEPFCANDSSVCGVGKCVQSLTRPFYSCNCGSFPNTFANNITQLVKCEQSGCFAANPCQNGGTCSNRATVGAFTCQCPMRYTGVKCERQSACFNNPCINGGICEVYNDTVYLCKCPPYFTGQRCEISNPDPCRAKNCGSFAVCTDVQGIAMCKCSNGSIYQNGSFCEDPCKSRDCGPGTCSRRSNATVIEGYCTCPVTRTGDKCQTMTDKCREAPRCGGGYCKTDYTTPRGYRCICENGVSRLDPCPISPNCLIKTCGTEGICTETDGLLIPPSTRPIFYVCTCLRGYISIDNCNAVLKQVTDEGATICGNGTPYPSRNPSNPIGCLCNNGTHIEERIPLNATQLCG